MGLTKSERFTEEQNELAALAKVLGHPARIAILQFLAKQSSCVCGSIVDEVGLAQATVSQHLKALKSVGLITGNIEGTSVCYCIDEQKWNEMRTLLTTFLSQSNSTNGSCC